jgi:hypothetical protein
MLGAHLLQFDLLVESVYLLSKNSDGIIVTKNEFLCSVKGFALTIRWVDVFSYELVFTRVLVRRIC